MSVQHSLSSATPHSGYHWDQRSPRFFEGWYYRVTLPEIGQTFGFMYSIDDPLGDQPHSGGAVQILGANDQYLYRIFPNIQQFWADRNQLGVGHWGSHQLSLPPQLLDPQTFEKAVEEGYQATATVNQGFIGDRATQQSCCWYYTINPIYGWGDKHRNQKATGGLLSYLPIFDPGWQVLMAHGLATGWIDWNGEKYEFSDVPAYSEKNWGRSFPKKWFWINCNSFLAEPDLALTVAGAIRQVLWWEESVGIIGLHYQGKLYQFESTKGQLNWRVEPWGRWEIRGENERFTLTIIGTTDQLGNYVRVPTSEGLQFRCRDTMQGKITLELRHHQGKLILKTISYLGGLEIGGEPWDQPWIYPGVVN
ncbi:tocopherol cyclase [Rippkaea orientalis PCC 8801]|uniref:Tocopherol cyclase n=1 Tax=Rippkaea orientalis (strain PCC 8801 / RF-1) TaxID=41431 RepID=B7K111_RIPO1|nr:tocopherol cyclase family protein [Rippkaea orientalis]ACK65152.1 tocopherol cyclase [Rippkaea orientalis PCC 8801]